MMNTSIVSQIEQDFKQLSLSDQLWLIEKLLQRFRQSMVQQNDQQDEQIASLAINASIDPWDNLDLEAIAVDTGITDFAKNHDHYLYGTPKK